jgi:hypothetical protein
MTLAMILEWGVTVFLDMEAERDGKANQSRHRYV